MYKILTLLFISIFLASCTSKNSAFRYFNKNELEAKSVRATKKVDIVKNKEVNTIFMATYLNQVDSSLVNDEKEEFLIFIYFADLNSQNIEDNGYSFFLNENEPKSIEKIEKDNNIYKSFMLKNYWGSYYLVKFSEQIIEDDKQKFILNLSLQNQEARRIYLQSQRDIGKAINMAFEGQDEVKEYLQYLEEQQEPSLEQEIQTNDASRVSLNFVK